MIPRPHLALLAITLWPLCTRGETAQAALERATAAVQVAAPRAQADPRRPIFHVTAPAQWINDPNGPIYHKGCYHLFYQLHPFSDASGPKYWGHVRSRDLVRWEHLPIALAPSGDAGETEVWSGCCTVNGLGQPMIFYTSIGPDKAPFDHADQWAATGDDDLIRWQKSPANPVLSGAANGGAKIYEWRDPFVFHEAGKTFMVLGGNLNETKGGQAVVNLYEAENAALTQWKYRGVLYALPDAAARTSECPNFFQLGDEWVLFVSPYGKVQYFVGQFEAATGQFHPRMRGVLDHGSSFYAPNTMLVPDGRRLVWGWVNGFPGGQGWNGCLSLPRQLSLSRAGELCQNPAPQLEKLRGPESSWRNLRLDEIVKSFPLPGSNSFEIAVEMDLQQAASIHLQITSARQDAPVAMNYDGLELQVMDGQAPLTLPKGARKLALRIFMDRSVLEVFANETVCLTKTVTPLGPAASLELSAAGGRGSAKQLQVWPMKTIW